MQIKFNKYLPSCRQFWLRINRQEIVSWYSPRKMSSKLSRAPLYSTENLVPMDRSKTIEQIGLDCTWSCVELDLRNQQFHSHRARYDSRSLPRFRHWGSRATSKHWRIQRMPSLQRYIGVSSKISMSVALSQRNYWLQFAAFLWFTFSVDFQNRKFIITSSLFLINWVQITFFNKMWLGKDTEMCKRTNSKVVQWILFTHVNTFWMNTVHDIH